MQSIIQFPEYGTLINSMYCNSRYCGLFLTHHSRRRTSHRIHMKLLTHQLVNQLLSTLESRQIKSCEAVEETQTLDGHLDCALSVAFSLGLAVLGSEIVPWKRTQYSMCRTPARSVAWRAAPACGILRLSSNMLYDLTKTFIFKRNLLKGC